MDVIEQLALASESPEPLSWTYEGSCAVGPPVGDQKPIVASWGSGGCGIIDDRDRAIWQMSLTGRYRERVRTVSLADPDGSWRTEHAYPCQRQADTTQLKWLRMWNRRSDLPVVATVLIVTTAATSIAFPDPIPVVPGVIGRHTGENGLVSRVCGRTLLLRPISLNDVAYLAIAYEGRPLSESTTISLLSVLELLTGRPLHLCAQIASDANGNTVERELFAWHQAPTCEPRPAVDLLDSDTVTAVRECLETMVERARELRFDLDIAIDVAIKYLHRWNGGQLDLEIRDITSALNVIIESPAFAPAKSTLVDSTTFTNVCDDINAAIDSRKLPDDFKQRLRQRIQEANSISTRERRRCLWQAVGFEPTPDEANALRRRHVMGHKGFIEPQSSDEEHSLLQDIDRTRTLVDEVLLALLHYDGPVGAYGAGLRPIRRARGKA